MTNRKRLAVMLRQLGSGALSIEDFENAVEKLELEKPIDLALLHILSFAAGFYDEDSAPILMTRFRGKYRLKPDDRRRIAMAVVFLHSELEYEWPEDFNHPYLHDIAFLWLCALTACASLIALPLVVVSLLFLIVGVGFMSATVWLFWYAKRYHAKMHERWKSQQLASGRDYNVWPFVNLESYNSHLKRPRLLAGN